MSETNYVGQVIQEKYRIVNLLGSGGMGSVYLAQHTLIGKKVAVKFLHTKFAQKDELITRFYREAQAAAEIGHQNIADVIDMGVAFTGEPYIIMEYLEGESLANMLARVGTMNLGAACGVLEPVLLALEAAHGKGIIHRDLKPENVFLVHTQGGAPLVKLIDFGVSKFADKAQTNLTATGSLLGTPAYMSPEQVRGDSDIDSRADIYSIGVMFYQMLAGRLPFDGEQYHELLAAALTKMPIPPLDANSDFPVEAEPLVLKSLAKSREDCPARDMLDALVEYGDYSQRSDELRKCTADLTMKTICSGDLGGFEEGESLSSAAAYVQMVKESGTKGEWTDSRVSDKRPAKVNVIVGVVVGAVAFVVSVVLVLVFAFGNGDNDAATVSDADVEKAEGPVEDVQKSPASPATAAVNVQIEVRGAPEGAKISYDGIPVPVNPFRVEIKDTIVPLRVKAEGYNDFVTWVVPSVDQVVNVSPVKTGAEKIEIPAIAQDKVDPDVKDGDNAKGSTRGQAGASDNSDDTPKKKKTGTRRKNRRNIKEGQSGARFKTDFD